MLRFTDNASPFELQALSFQNILCYGLPCRSDCIPVKECQFQNILCYGLPVCRFLESARFRISKHPMLRFTFEPGKHTNWLFIISKHPMLRFTDEFLTRSYYLTEFQNILCYGLPTLTTLSSF